MRPRQAGQISRSAGSQTPRQSTHFKEANDIPCLGPIHQGRLPDRRILKPGLLIALGRAIRPLEDRECKEAGQETHHTHP